MSTTGTARTTLIVLRGNSGSGKSTTAQALRLRLGRGTAWVEQDYLRRILLREHAVAGGANIGLIDLNVRYALDHGYDVILEGILEAGHHGDMLASLRRDHTGQTLFYYFSISFEETLRRHATRPLADKVTPAQMSGWYKPGDLLDFGSEHVIPEGSTLDETVDRIIRDRRAVAARVR